MVFNEQVLLTRKGFEQKQKRLDECLYLLHDVIPKRLKLALEHSRDLDDNSEYRDLEIDKEILEAEARRLENMLDHAKVLDLQAVGLDRVGIGVRVILKNNLNDDKLSSFELVSPAEVDLERGRISTQSPLGERLLGKRIGSEVTISTSLGTITYKVVDIQHCNEDFVSFLDS